MAFPRSVRNYTAWVDGIGYAGIVHEATMPDLQLQTSDYRGGGMDGVLQVDMGLQVMTASLVFKEHNPALSARIGQVTHIVLRAGALGEDDFEADKIVYTLDGRITQHTPGAFRAAEDVMLTLQQTVTRYRLEHNDQIIHDIDVEAGKRVIDGVDQVASIRLAMGL